MCVLHLGTPSTNVPLSGCEDIQSSSDALKALEGLQRLAVVPPPHQAGQEEPPSEAPRLRQQNAPARQVSISRCILILVKQHHCTLSTDISISPCESMSWGQSRVRQANTR